MGRGYPLQPHLRMISVGLGIAVLLLIVVVIRVVSVEPPRPIVVRVDEVGRAEALAYEVMEAQADPLDPPPNTSSIALSMTSTRGGEPPFKNTGPAVYGS